MLRLLRPACLVLAVVLCAGAAQAQGDPRGRTRTEAGRLAEAEGQLVRGLTEHAIGNDSSAVRHLTRALALAPGSAAVHDALAEVHETLGDRPTALFHAEAAARAAPSEPSLHLRLGRLRASAGLPDAEAALAEARRLAPSDPEPLVALAELYGAAGRADDEREALEALIRLGDAPGARLRLADLAAARGDTARALALLDAAIRLAPAEPALRARRDALAGVVAPSRPEPLPDASAGSPASGDVEALLARTAATPGDLAAWTSLLDTLAGTADARAPAAADDAVLFFPASPGVLAPAAEIFRAAGRTAEAQAAAQAGLDALDALGDTAPPDADALRTRLRRALTP